MTCTCRKGARCIACIERDGLTKERCPGCGGDASDNWFDRSRCPCEPGIGTMHTRCVNCGYALDGCSVEIGVRDEKTTGVSSVLCSYYPECEGLSRYFGIVIDDGLGTDVPLCRAHAERDGFNWEEGEIY